MDEVKSITLNFKEVCFKNQEDGCFAEFGALIKKFLMVKITMLDYSINNTVDYDYQNDSLFVYSVNPYEYEVSVELDNNVILDVDVDGKPVAFEFLNASKVFCLDKNNFNNLSSICIQADITEEIISLKVQLSVPLHNGNQVFDVNRVTSNLNNIPAMETELVTA